MLARAVLTLHRALVLVVLTVALTATGFAHRMPSDQDAALAFALANGAGAADFCGDGPDQDGATHCPACQIAAGADLPPISTLVIDLELAFQADVTAPRDRLGSRMARDPAHSPQGPPVA
jgi:hypothetical protein